MSDAPMCGVYCCKNTWNNRSEVKSLLMTHHAVKQRALMLFCRADAIVVWMECCCLLGCTSLADWAVFLSLCYHRYLSLKLSWALLCGFISCAYKVAQNLYRQKYIGPVWNKRIENRGKEKKVEE